MKRNRFGVFCSTALSVAILALALSGCSGDKGAKKEESAEPYKIGAIFSVTGRGAPIGQPERETAELMRDQINAAGGINGRMIELIVEDDEGDETKAMMAAKKLIEKDGVIAIIGPSLSGPTLAISQYVAEAQVPMVACAASVKIVDPVNPWVFQVALTDRHSVNKILTYLTSQGINKIAFINDSNAYGVSGKAEMTALAPKKGVEVVAWEAFGGEDTDMTPQLTRVKASGAQAIVVWGTNPGPAVITRNMKQLKMTIPLVQSHGVANMKYIELSGDSSEGVVLPAGRLIVANQLPDSDPQKQILLDYTKAFTEKYNKPPDHYGGHGYDAIMLTAKAVEKAGADRALIRETLEKTTGFIGTDGIFNITPEDHNGLSEDSFVMVRVENGQWKLLDQ
ncbi:MAG TPA: ABC transporter substrate-binding protein [bacterium]|nr:ABC transporter substrate-binding protein [bacterium]HPI77635.1 ABC transporter substrate-binding protein [bacterium]HPN93116.1 ABC transporter substrate-binding protein [bacterium]